MKQLILIPAVLWATVFASEAALAQDPLGNAVQGEDLARVACAECHAIDPGFRGTDITGAPSFQDVADMPSTTPLSLRVFLRSPHLTMPNFALSDDQIDDLIAYIRSLR